MLSSTAPIKNLSMSVELYNANNVYSTTDRVVLTCSVDVRTTVNSTIRV